MRKECCIQCKFVRSVYFRVLRDAYVREGLQMSYLGWVGINQIKGFEKEVEVRVWVEGYRRYGVFSDFVCYFLWQKSIG